MSRAHHSWAWQKVRAQRFAMARDAREPCGRCGGEIDYTLSGMAWAGCQIDHVLPVSTHPHLALDLGNTRPVHRYCNHKHGSRLGGLAAQGMLTPGTPTPAPTPPPVPDPLPWQRAYARYMATLGDGGSPSLYLHNSRPWCAPWTVADFDAGLVTDDGVRR